MRLHRLHIRPCQGVSGFKNLIDFIIDFDKDSPTAVLVGRNGTGKSNVLEALTVIFRDLDLELSTPPFSYELDYTCHGRHIQVDADPDRTSKKVQISVDGKELSWKAFRENKRAYLPNYVFGYYSGPSNRMQDHFLKHQERFYTELINSADDAVIPLRPLSLPSIFTASSYYWPFSWSRIRPFSNFLMNSWGSPALIPCYSS